MSKMLNELKAHKKDLDNQIEILERQEQEKLKAERLISSMPNTPNLNKESVLYLDITISSYNVHMGKIRVPYNRDIANIIDEPLREIYSLLYEGENNDE